MRDRGYGPGEAFIQREIARRMPPGSKLLLFELDRRVPATERQFCGRPRACTSSMAMPRALTEELEAAGSRSAIKFFRASLSASRINKKRALLEQTYEGARGGRSFIIYQVTNELRQHAKWFDRADSEFACKISRRCSSPFSIKAIVETA